MRHFLTLFAVTAVAFCAACSQTVNTHGHMLKQEQINSLKVGDSKETVLRTLGSPSTTSTFADKRWYYYNAVTTSTAFNPNQLQERTILIIDFDDTGRISALNTKTKDDGVALTPNERTTKTHGQKLGLIDHLAKGVGIAQ